MTALAHRRLALLLLGLGPLAACGPSGESGGPTPGSGEALQAEILELARAGDDEDARLLAASLVAEDGVAVNDLVHLAKAMLRAECYGTSLDLVVAARDRLEPNPKALAAIETLHRRVWQEWATFQLKELRTIKGVPGPPQDFDDWRLQEEIQGLPWRRE